MSFSVRFLLIMLIFSVLYGGSIYLIRRYYQVKHLSWWRHNYINDEHKRFDRLLRAMAIILIIIGTIVNYSRGINDELWFFQPWVILFAMIIIGQFLRAYMEKKYVENENYYKASVSEGFVLIIVLFITQQTNFYGLLF